VLVKAGCKAVGYAADEPIDRRHPVRSYGVSTLLTTILDSPEFFQR
jgi:hypothetical protein